MYGNNICRENTNVYLKRGPVSFQHLRWKLELTSLYSDTVSMNYLNWLSKMRKLWSSCILNFSFWTQFCILKNLKKTPLFVDCKCQHLTMIQLVLTVFEQVRGSAKKGATIEYANVFVSHILTVAENLLSLD